MKFWIIEEGEKRGPLEGYELRELIEQKKVTDETKVWHEGAEGWANAREVSLLKGEFLSEDSTPPPVVVEAEQIPVQRVSMDLLWRRFFARWFDFFLYQVLLAFVMHSFGMKFFPTNPEEYNLFRLLISFLPMIVIESVFIQAFGITPGKYLLNLRVVNQEGGLLTLGGSMMRALRIWVLGMGMQIFILPLIAHAIALWFCLKKGAPIWDLVPGYRVESRRMSGLQWAVFILAGFGLMVGLSFVLGPEAEEFAKTALEQMNTP